MRRDREPTSGGSGPSWAGGSESIDDFAKIIREHWTPVYRFVYCVLGNAHDAEDLTQETFLRAWDRIATFRPGTSPRSWLLTIAANASRDVQRRRGRVGFRSLDHDPAGQGPGPDHRMEAAERDELLATALEQLTETTRMVFHLRVQEDLSFREIAEAARFDDLADELLARMNRAARKGDAGRFDHSAALYHRVLELGIESKLDVLESTGALDFDRQRRLERLILQNEGRMNKLVELLERMPDSSRKQIKRALGIKRRPKKQTIEKIPK